MASEIIVQNLKGPASGANANKVIVPSGHTLDASGGTLMPSPDQILQVKHLDFQDQTSTTTSQTYVDASGTDITLTAKGSSSKFYLIANCQMYHSSGLNGANIGFKRGSTKILGVDGGAGDTWFGFGNATNLTNASFSISRSYLDSPSLTAGTSVTYKIMFGLWNSGTVYVNYTTYNTTSHFTVMEIAQ
jgi:hypothetical protein